MWGRARERYRAISPEAGDAILYGLSAVFALITILASSLALYRQWAALAIAPFMFGAVASGVSAFVVARRARRSETGGDSDSDPASNTEARSSGRRQWIARIAIATVVFAGATAIPLGLEIVWRSNGDPGPHVQPEVTVIERGGQTIVTGKDPYHAVTNPDGKIVYHAPGESTVDAFLPYLPLMTVFGIPSYRKHDVALTDARIFFSLVTLLVAALALWLCPADGRRKMRALQVIAILPTAALPLATGGDDMPVVAFLLLAMVLAQRRQPFASGVVLGIVSAMKFTAWPLAALALFAARNKKGERRPLIMFLGMLVVAGPVVVPYRAPRAVGLLRQRDPVSAGPLRRQIARGQPAPGPSHRDRIPVLASRPPGRRRDRGRSSAGVVSLQAATADRVAGLQGRWRRDGCHHPLRTGHTYRLPAVPDQLLRLGPPLLGP